MVFRSFASDNNSGVHPEIMQALVNANHNHCIAYGDDDYTRAAIEEFKKRLGPDIDVYFVFNGTGANVLGIKTLTHSFHALICTETAHINVDECAAPEKYTGCKILTVPGINGKITITEIQRHMHGFDFEHHAQPFLISISQTTELGTIYTPHELKKLCDFAHQYGLLVHMDGARISNAVAALGIDIKEITTYAGIDVLSFGGGKNGMMYGEAVVFFNKNSSRNFKYIRKQGMQLGSKMRYIGAQFSAFFKDDLWISNARHSNKMACLLAEKVKNIPGIKITRPVEANGIFAIIPRECIAELQKHYFFYVWDEHLSEVRWMTSFDTTEEDVEKFAALVKKIVSAN